MKGVYGITLLNGRIGLDCSVYSNHENKEIQAMRIVTLLHETFGHKKRIDYVDNANVLISTAKRFKEAGNYVELAAFGGILDDITKE